MRIATSTYFDNTLSAIENQRADLNTLNNELSTGKQVNQPSDDPVAFTNAQRLGSQDTALTQYNSDNAQLGADLGLGSQTLNEILSVVNNVVSIAEQAANGTTNTQNRAALVEQVTSLQSQLVSLANTQNGNGVYLFAGSRGNVSPFAPQPDGSVAYRGDAAAQTTHTGQNQTASSLLNGSGLANSLGGNGYASISASSTNAGSATATLDGVTAAATATAFRESGAPYTISFNTAGSQLGYTVTRGGTTVGTGTYTPGMNLSLSGTSLSFSGTPQPGDTFTLSPSKPSGLFDSVQQLVTALNQPVGTASSNALNAQRLGGILSNLDQAKTGILSMQSSVGVAMRAINNSSNANTSQQDSAKATISTDVDADIPSVLTGINEQTASLNAAMAAFGKLSQLSLFSYIQA